ncbi:hypothetical protein [Kibdelosporangium philippinense]|uniref:hypothetical protein n=1 Tax=Kibdelosporangium philippinense TaxID=211113 RepID=UPI00361E4BE5
MSTAADSCKQTRAATKTEEQFSPAVITKDRHAEHLSMINRMVYKTPDKNTWV